MTALIPILILLPLCAAILLMVLVPNDRRIARWTALFAAAFTFAISLVLAGEFHAMPRERSPTGGPVQSHLEFRQTWLSFEQPAAIVGGPSREMKLEFHLGMDGISLTMVLLTTLLTISAVLVSWKSVTERSSEFYAWLLALETGMLGAFCAFDILLFYVFFEFTLIPLFFLVGVWGGPERRRAAKRFFIYTLAGSLLTLIGLVALVLEIYVRGKTSTPFSIPEIARQLAATPLPVATQRWMFLCLSAGFIVKVPLFPFHTWLPLAHVEAPTAGSVLLAGVLLKLGTYGFLRTTLPFFPAATWEIGVPLIAVLSVIGIIYGALCALAQNDVKRLVAFSSVSHLGFCMLGLFALNVEGISGGVLQMINHGLSTGGLFLLVGMLYERYHTRKLSDYSGMAARLPLLSLAMIFMCFSSMGLPGLNGFTGEFLSLIGMFKARPLFGVLGTVGVVLGAWYLLSMLQQVFFGPIKEPGHAAAHTSGATHGIAHGGAAHGNHDPSHGAHSSSHGSLGAAHPAPGTGVVETSAAAVAHPGQAVAAGGGHEKHDSHVMPGHHGHNSHDGHHGHAIRDLTLRELIALVPIVILCVWIGVRPQPLLETIRPDVEALAKLYEHPESLRERPTASAVPLRAEVAPLPLEVP